MRVVQRRLKQTEVVVWLTIVGILLGSASVVANDWLTNRTDAAASVASANSSRSRMLVDAELIRKVAASDTTARNSEPVVNDPAPSESPATTAPTTTASPTTAPATEAPTSTAEPRAAAPTTAAPETAPPTTQPPTTQPPTTQPPTTQPPTTQPPTTPAPTDPPTTPAPETQPPTTPAPTDPPTTAAPETQPPTTAPPETQPPVTDPPTDGEAGADDGFETARILSFTLINARDDFDLFNLSNGATVSLDEVGNRLSIRANVNQNVGSVVWYIDGRQFKVENNNPYSLAGNNGGNYGAVKVEPGTYTVSAQMFSERRGRGLAGHAVTMTLTFT